MFLGLQDPDPSLLSFYQQATLISPIFLLLFYFLSMKTDVNVWYLQKVISKKTRKKIVFVGVLRSLTKRARPGSGAWSISQSRGHCF
jgi:hypothetical protein